MTTTPPAVDLDELAKRPAWDAAGQRCVTLDAEERDALISELRSSRSMMEGAAAALTPFSTDEFMDRGEDRTIIATWHGGGYSFQSSPERILRATDFARAQSALTTIKEKTT